MGCIVQKFGGTSVADLNRIRNVADIIKEELNRDNQVAVIVSAMAGDTDRLVELVGRASRFYDHREYDVVVAAGEQISSGLLALTLQKMGIPARSWLGWQIPIRTNEWHGKALIEKIEVEAMKDHLNSGEVAVISGFQGLSPDKRITTLGRGGSDTSAVAVAAALEADRCDIYTDVDGVYTCDPRLVKDAKKLEKITFEEMLELSSQGAKVLHPRSVALASRHNVKLQVLSSLTRTPGTLVVSEDEKVEQGLVSGIAYNRNEAKITLRRVADRPGVAASIFGPLAAAGINVDMIVQNISEDRKATDVTFTVERTDLKRTMDLLNERRASLGYTVLSADDSVGKISIIGVGMRSNAGVAELMFKTLAEKGINILVISTSEIKVSVLVEEEYTDLAVRALHSAYDLDKSDIKQEE